MAPSVRPFIDALQKRGRVSRRARILCVAALLIGVGAPLVLELASSRAAHRAAEPIGETANGPRLVAHAVARRAIVELPPDAPTYWTGVAGGQAAREPAPPWAIALIASEPLTEDQPILGPPAADGLIEIDVDALETHTVGLSGYTVVYPLGERPEGADETTRFDPAVAAALSLDASGRATAPPASAPTPRRRPELPPETRPAATADGGPRIVIILTAVGVNPGASRRAIDELPPEIAFAVAPIADNPADWVAASRASGRVVLAEVPMETASRRAEDPGPLTLRVADGVEANLGRLDHTLALMPDVDGVATYLGDRFTTDANALRPVLAELDARGLFLVETRPGPLSRVRDIGSEIGLPTAASVVSLDKSGRARDISDGLALLEEEARRTGRAIGVAVAVPSTIRALDDWSETARARGFQLTPLRL